MPVDINEYDGNAFEASRIFSNLFEQDLAEIRIHFNVPNDIELLCHGQF